MTLSYLRSKRFDDTYYHWFIYTILSLHSVKFDKDVELATFVIVSSSNKDVSS